MKQLQDVYEADEKSRGLSVVQKETSKTSNLCPSLPPLTLSLSS